VLWLEKRAECHSRGPNDLRTSQKLI
jgi:hypothetical protein